MRTTTNPPAASISRWYRVMLFDFDGTVADTVPLIMESFQYVFTRLTGSPGDERYLLSTIGEPLERTFRVLPEALRDEAMQLYFRYNEEKLASGVGIFIGMNDMLQRIRRSGALTGIVTSKRRSVATFTIDQFDLGRYFDVSITRESTLRHKPHPDPIDKALEELEKQFVLRSPIDRRDVLFVGDSIHDLLCARNAGVDMAMVDWTYMDKDGLRREKPEHWIMDAGEIAAMARMYERKEHINKNKEKRDWI
jgi:pyrophosphatase PpaX